MIPNLSNVLSWIEQGMLIAAVGAFLPIAFRIRHPSTQMVYCHLLLAACLILPLVEPWQHPIIYIRSGSKAAAAAGYHVPALVIWILAGGAMARLGFLLVGLWQIRRRRIAAMPLYPIPESVRAASAITHADAVLCISEDVEGPVMLGWLSPVVLLPESFLAFGEEAQCAVACHELLHVRRNDWLVTLLEEAAGALLWFNPAVWLLLAQTRLAREQVVDAEVVRLTAAREPYIDALMSIARARPGADLAPSPLFLRRRHLTQRMHSLLQDASMSNVRLVSSYSSMLAILAFAGWFAFAAFPLVGSARVEELAEVSPAAVPVATAAPVSNSQPEARGQERLLNPQIRSSSLTPQNGLEPVTGGARFASSPEDRAAALSLLARATENSRMHLATMPPYILRVSFVANGPVTYTGVGEITETWISGQQWRWTANLADFSTVRMAARQRTVEEKKVSFVPLRVQMMREAIFWAARSPLVNALRTAGAQVNGKPVTCILNSGMRDSGTQTRLWEEEERCIDNSGVLQLHSIAPGTYAVYGYSKNQKFHGRVIPDQVTIYVNGVSALEAQVSLTDAVAVDTSLLTPTPEMMSGGPVISLDPTRFAINVPSPVVSGDARPVIVHASIDPEGNVLEEELSSSSDSSLTQTALDLVKQRNFGPARYTQRDAYINVRFIPQE